MSFRDRNRKLNHSESHAYPFRSTRNPIRTETVITYPNEVWYDATVKRNLRALLLAFGALALAAAFWLWWNRPQPVEMAAYVPQDSLVYLESNSLPDILRGIASTEAWRTLAPAAGVRPDVAQLGWLTRLAKWTGIGSAESVIFSRAQVAVAVLGIDAKEGRDSELQISPRLVIVVETHTGETRVQKAITNVVGDFARRTYGEPKFERADRDGTPFFIWTAPGGDKKIIAAVSGSVVFVGNDEAAVQSCLAVRRGERASLATDPELAEMRQRVGADDGALAFGYVPQASAPKLTQIAALVLAGQSSAGAKEQSALAIIIPQLAARLIGGAAWSAKVENDAIEDDYFFALTPDLTRRLAVALEAAPTDSFQSTDYLPADTHQVSRYNFSEPEQTWRGINAVVSSQLDPTFAPFAGSFLEKSLSPFGIDSPRDFLRTIGTEITTARLDEDGEELVLVAAVRDETSLREMIKKRLGSKARIARVGSAEMLVSADAELGAASIIESHVILGSEQSVRRCLEARAAGTTISATDAFKKPLSLLKQGESPLVLTLTDERERASRFIALVARRRAAGTTAPDAATLTHAVASLPYSASATRLATDGLERKTISPFGQFATIALQLAPESSARK
jgi:hypothetical protein